MIRKIAACIAALLMVWSQQQAGAQVRITEWMYDGAGGEFFELTNMGLAPVSLNSWSYDDDSRLPNIFDLSPLGTLAPGESAVVTEAVEAAFRTAWSLAPTVKVLGGYTNNLGRNDEINIYDDLDVLVDRLTYGDQNIPGTIRTQGRSGNPISLAALGANDAHLWELSNALGDVHGSYFSTGGAQGNPGFYSAVPEPTSLVLGGLSMLATLAIRRRS
jgi:predicted extracellular nuclease